MLKIKIHKDLFSIIKKTKLHLDPDREQHLKTLKIQETLKNTKTSKIDIEKTLKTFT